MKKIVLSIVIACFGFGVNAHKGQIDILKELGEEGLYKEYWGVRVEDGKYTGNVYEAKKVLRFTYNSFGKIMAFDMDKETVQPSPTNTGNYVPNHYTQPSVFHHAGPNVVLLYLDGIVYKLKGIKDPSNITSFEIDRIYVPEVQADESGDSNEPKKKMTLKEKIADAKAKLASGGVPSSITEKDHEAIIKDYLAAMKPIQEAATANLTDEEKKEIEALENADAEQFAKMQADQRERAKRFAENRAKEEGIETKYTIQNNTGGLAHFISNGGSGDDGYFSLNSSGKRNVSCKEDTYHAVQDGMGTWRKGGLIVTGSSSCGKTIAVE